MSIITEKYNSLSSSIVMFNKKSDSKIPSSPKRKVLISPSKDLLTFFDQTNLTKIISTKTNKNQK